MENRNQPIEVATMVLHAVVPGVAQPGARQIFKVGYYNGPLTYEVQGLDAAFAKVRDLDEERGMAIVPGSDPDTFILAYVWISDGYTWRIPNMEAEGAAMEFTLLEGSPLVAIASRKSVVTFSGAGPHTAQPYFAPEKVIG